MKGIMNGEYEVVARQMMFKEKEEVSSPFCHCLEKINFPVEAKNNKNIWTDQADSKR